MIEKAIAWILGIANDNSHGYDQGNRWGPDYDCSSLVISSWESAGVPVKSNGATYTGNMRSVFIRCGFEDVTSKVNTYTGAGLERGDVLLNQTSHTAMYLGNGQLVQASGNEHGGITGGTTGDQTGREIAVGYYYNFPWDCILRYVENVTETSETRNEKYHTVQSGDTLWGISVQYGLSLDELRNLNPGISDMIYPGQVIKLEADDDTLSDTVIDFSGYVDTDNSGRRVTVEKGDTLWGIAEKYMGGGWHYAELAAANNIPSDKVNNIMVGQVLVIP